MNIEENLFEDICNVAVLPTADELPPGDGSWLEIEESSPFTAQIGSLFGLFVRVRDVIIELNTFERMWHRDNVPQLLVTDITYRDVQILVDGAEPKDLD